MRTPVDIRELPLRIEELLSIADAEGEVILTDGSTPRARLVPIDPPPSVRRFVAGLHAGATTDGYDAPLPDESWTGQR